MGPPSTACPAPGVVMDFAPEGHVHACCVNAAWPIGDVRRQGLREIWDGDRARALRAALARGDLGYGCGNCRHRLALGTGYADVEYYRHLPPPRDPAWPEVMAFGLSNTCNLACTMCGGNLSSRLAAQEGRPRLQPAYGDRFFAELVDFLPHLRRAEFRGGEPFLIREHHRVWDLLADLDAPPEVQVTTNGTIWDDRVTRVLDRFPVQVTFSLDGVTAATNESIRVGSDHEVVLANARRFATYTREAGTRFDLSFCLLQQNWRELADLVRLADELGGEAHAQIVLERDQGLHRLPTDELTRVVDQLAAERDRLDVAPANQALWDRVVGWLRAELAQRSPGPARRIWEQPGPDNLPSVADHRRLVGRHPIQDAEPWAAELAEWSSTGAVAVLVTDAEDRVASGDLSALLPPGVDDAGPTVGLGFEDALRRFAAVVGPHVWIIDDLEVEGRLEQTLFFAPSPRRDKVGLVVRLVSLAADTEEPGGVRTFAAADHCYWPDPTPVSLGPRPGG